MSAALKPRFEYASAERVPRRVQKLTAALAELAEAPFPSGFSVAVIDPVGPLYLAHGGDACRVRRTVPITGNTCYDLASLTKVVCSVTLVMMLAGRGALALDDPVERWLPRFPRTGTTLLHLLTHTSGLVWYRPFFKRVRGRGAIEAAVIAEATRSAPTGEVVYSDLNFMLLGWVIEACSSEPLDVLFMQHVATPLGMSRTRFRPSASEETAATELDGDQQTIPGLVWGEVHDGNARALGGVAGHAGLFAPLGDLVAFTQELLVPSGKVVTPAALEAMATMRAQSGGDIRGLGWRLSPEGWGSWPDGTLWHTGFTGTSLLAAPGADVGVVLLTNAIHPRRRLEELDELRADLHRIVSETFLA